VPEPRGQEPPRARFAFRPHPEALEAFRSASPEAKLAWLEEARRFVDAFLPPAERAHWDPRLAPPDEAPR
jgi:hypothetical protein